MEFSSKLLQLMDGRSQDWLAEQIGCSQNLVGTWCRGERLPSIRMLLDLSRFFGVDMVSLADDTMDATSPRDRADEEQLLTFYRSLRDTGQLDPKYAIAGLATGIGLRQSQIRPSDLSVDAKRAVESFWRAFATGDMRKVADYLDALGAGGDAGDEAAQRSPEPQQPGGGSIGPPQRERPPARSNRNGKHTG